MRILLIDSSLDFPTNPMLADALGELSRQGKCECRLIDEAEYLRPTQHSVFHRIAYKVLNRRPLTYWAFNRRLRNEAVQFRPNVVVIFKGSMVDEESLKWVKKE